jgi:hypothetical protein
VRKASSHKASDRRSDHLLALNRLISEHCSRQGRDSLNPLPRDACFRLLKDEVLSPETIETVLRGIGKEILVVGLILPRQLLA